jgi:signal transduction histidine kinase
MIGINWDITSIKQAEKDSQASEERYRFLSDAAHEAIILCREGIITEANQQFFRLTGRTEAELADGLPLSDILNPALLQTGETVTIDLHIRENDIDKLMVAEVSPMHYEFHGERVDALVIRDVSSQKETEKMLTLAKMRAEAANLAKSEFLTTMSHELRTPMNGIMGMTQLMKVTELNEEQHEYCDIIYDSSRALLKIINDLLDLASIESGKITLAQNPFDLRAVAAQTVELLTHQAREHKINLTVTSDANLPSHFIGDEGRIRQILLNLVGNAVKFTSVGRVQLALHTEGVSDAGTLVRIDIKDTGIGIPPDKIDIIFEKFTQVDQSDTRSYEGTGLGLNITKRLVELMKGSITCESTVNQGSTFTVILPLPHITIDLREDAEPSPLILSRPLHILLAEDDLTNRLTAENLLNKMGCSTVNALNGKETIDIAIEHSFDLILMDINMPELNGLDAAKRLRAAGIETPIIALSAGNVASDRKAWIAAGINEFLTKPIDQERLFRLLNRIAQK